MKRSGVTLCLPIIRKGLDVAMVLCGQRDDRTVDAMISKPALHDLSHAKLRSYLARLCARAVVAEERPRPR